jgi:hypothetical protein
MEKITLVSSDMLHIADLMDSLGDFIDAFHALLSNSSSEDILRISPLVSPLGEKLTTIKDEFLGFIEKAEAKE